MSLDRARERGQRQVAARAFDNGKDYVDVLLHQRQSTPSVSMPDMPMW